MYIYMYLYSNVSVFVPLSFPLSFSRSLNRQFTTESTSGWSVLQLQKRPTLYTKETYTKYKRDLC